MFTVDVVALSVRPIHLAVPDTSKQVPMNSNESLAKAAPGKLTVIAPVTDDVEPNVILTLTLTVLPTRQ